MIKYDEYWRVEYFDEAYWEWDDMGIRFHSEKDAEVSLNYWRGHGYKAKMFHIRERLIEVEVHAELA